MPTRPVFSRELRMHFVPDDCLAEVTYRRLPANYFSCSLSKPPLIDEPLPQLELERLAQRF